MERVGGLWRGKAAAQSGRHLGAGWIMDALAALRLQIEWGADEALADVPVDRYAIMPATLPAVLVPATLVRPPVVAVVVAAPVAVERAREAAGSAMTREALLEALAHFDGCALSATAGKLVFADGNPAAGLMLIGDCPGDEEDRAGVPFVGPAGRLLDRMFASIGLDRGGFLATNVVPWRPPGGRLPTDAETAICLPFLMRHIALVAPRRMVLLGNLATRAVLGGTLSPSRARGRWHAIEVPGLDAPVQALPMAHPLGLLKAPRGKREAWSDLLKLRQALNADRV